MIRRSTARTPVAAATTAALALAVSASLSVAPPAIAQAAANPFQIDCAAGSGFKNNNVDCSHSTASALPDAVGRVLKAFGVNDHGVITEIKKLNGASTPTVNAQPRRTATVIGRGYTAAIGAAATATATAESPAAVAVSLAGLDGVSTAKADPLGAAVAVTLGNPVGQGPKADARALPFGVAFANSSDALDPASATALLGWASAVSNRDKAIDGASCVGLYSQATGGGSSCTGVLFVFAKQTSTAAGAPTIWAVRDIFSLTTRPVIGKDITDRINTFKTAIPLPRAVNDRLQTPVAPVFTRDFLRLEQYADGTVLVRSDMPVLKPFFEWVNPGRSVSPAGPTAAAVTAPASPTVRSARSARSIPDEVELAAAPAAAVEAAPERETTAGTEVGAKIKAENESPTGTAAKTSTDAKTGTEAASAAPVADAAETAADQSAAGDPAAAEDTAATGETAAADAT